MNKDDLVRRGDALAITAASEDGSIGASDIAALPAVTVQVRPLVWEPLSLDGLHAFCPLFGVVHYADDAEDAAKQDANRAVRILAALDLTPAPDAAAIREAAQGLVAFLDAKHQSYMAAKGRNPADYVSGYSIARDKANAILALLPKGGA